LLSVVIEIPQGYSAQLAESIVVINGIQHVLDGPITYGFDTEKVIDVTEPVSSSVSFRTVST
jgi:hypothetical protein